MKVNHLNKNYNYAWEQYEIKINQIDTPSTLGGDV